MILLALHRTFYSIGKWFSEAEDHPAYRAIQSRRAYARFQADFRSKVRAAQKKHRATRPIERERYDKLHAAMGLRHGR